MEEKKASIEQKKHFLRELKKTYVDSLIQELKPSGDVLEVGFGLGDGANFIQKFKPKSHTIIESDPLLVREAQKWAANYQNVKIIEDRWESALPKLGTFDAIFYNDYPADNEIDLMQALNTEDAELIAKRSKELLKMLEDELQDVEVAYTDKELDEFFKQFGHQDPKEIHQFLVQLKQKGHITPKQYESAIKKYNIEVPKDKKPSYDFGSQASALLLFLENSLNSHMRKGSRFTAYLNDRTSKFEDSRFFDTIITNPHVHFEEKLLPIQVANCNGEVLVIKVEKLS